MQTETDARAGTVGEPGATADHTIDVRVLSTLDDFRRCVQLQRAIWGADFEDIVPASLMRASAHVGGMTIGAFSQEGELVGFVFGVAGVQRGESVHWSHMLGVEASQRNRGVGRRLKEYQRAQLARRGVARMYWTFDPLQARNAHLNLNRLGARVVEYVADMYGPSRSPLHHAVATDRLIVECATAAVRPLAADAMAAEHGLPVFTPFPRPGDVMAEGSGARAALIEVPWDLQAVVDESAARANTWRAATREAFLLALANGYEVMALHRQPEQQRAFFVIRKRNDPAG